MEKENSLQLELFSHSNASTQENKAQNGSFLSFLWAYEKAILIIMAVVVTGIVAFSIGVERGKKITVPAVSIRAQPVSIPVKTLVTAPQKQVQPVIKVETQKTAYAPVLNKGYLIQLASFKSKPNAQSEAQTLKKKGFSSVLFSKGNLTVLCVGNLSNQEAQSLLPQFKKTYKDCYIRRL